MSIFMRTDGEGRRTGKIREDRQNEGGGRMEYDWWRVFEEALRRKTIGWEEWKKLRERKK